MVGIIVIDLYTDDCHSLQIFFFWVLGLGGGGGGWIDRKASWLGFCCSVVDCLLTEIFLKCIWIYDIDV